jgi:hypothetical protein
MHLSHQNNFGECVTTARHFPLLQHGLFDSKFDSFKCISISVESLIEGLFCAGAGMISFGALLGKASPTQVVLLLLLEVPLYSFNAEYLVDGIFGKLGAQVRACLTATSREQQSHPTGVH